VLAHAFEERGLATVQLASIRSYVERMRPPRALYCEFPLGRPLGKPGDAEFQRNVLEAAFALLDRESGPVLEDFPERIDGDATAAPLACSVPPQHAASGVPEVDEVRALRPAYERQLAASGRTNVGHAAGADDIAGAVAAIVRVADGIGLEAAGLPGPLRQTGLDIRAYFEEAAIALAGHVPEARQAESWFFRTTKTGATLKRAQAVMRDSGAPREAWYFLVPVTQQD
jgi:hypothetical protein